MNTRRKYVNQIFEDAEISLDNLDAQDVIFKNCRLTFADIGETDLVGCDFDGCNFIFVSQEAHDAFFKAFAKGKGNTR